MIEAKSVKRHKIYWTAITENQHEQLDFYDSIFGVTSLIFIEYREEKESYILPYRVLKELKAKGEKGLSVEMAREMDNVYKIPAQYQIVNCILDEQELRVILGRIGMTI
jgi:penicillin-binding protein-related factor A (putative recombinase)